jgi:malonyl-CoA O-methyltransferase
MKPDCSTLRHFSRAAGVYDAEARVQRDVAGRLLEYLTPSRSAQRVLELGCGTGFLTAGLLRLLPEARIDAIDIAPAMIRQARRAAAGQHAYGRGCARFKVCDVWDYRAPQPYHLIVSSSALQWMQPLEALFERLASMLQPGGRLLCAVMVEGTLEELHRLRRAIAPHKVPPASLPQPAAASAALKRAGFRLLRSAEETLQVEYRSSKDFLRSIRQLGFTGGSLSTSSRLLTRGELERLVCCYQTACALPQGGVRASYAAWYFDALSETR